MQIEKLFSCYSQFIDTPTGNGMTHEEHKTVVCATQRTSVSMAIASSNVEMNHGNPRPRRMSNTFEPTVLGTAMSPLSSRATSTELRASGIEVPHAHNNDAEDTAEQNGDKQRTLAVTRHES